MEMGCACTCSRTAKAHICEVDLDEVDVSLSAAPPMLGEALGAVAALQQESLTARDIGQVGLEPLDLRRDGDRRHAFEHGAHRRGLVEVPGRLLQRRLGQRGVEAVPQLFGQRRKRRQLIDGYVDGPVHPSMVTAGQNRISRPVMSW